LEIAIASFTVAFSGAAAPGPLLLTVMRESAGQDLRVGGWLSAGHALIELPVVLLLGVGLLRIDTNLIMPWLEMLGGTALIAFGLLTLRASAAVDASAFAGTRGGKLTPLRLVLLGGITSASNPYWTLWWLTVGVAYIVQALILGPLGLLVFYISHIAGDAVVFMSVSALTSKGGRALGSRGYRALLVVTGLALILIGASYAASALRVV